MIDSPNLNCINCVKLYAENRTPPMCRKPAGCEIEDVASDFQLNQFVSRYVMARKIYEHNKIADMLIRELESLGLNDDNDLLLRMEAIFIESRCKPKEPEIQQTTWKKR